MAVNKERDMNEEIVDSTSQATSEFNCEDESRTSTEKGGRNTRRLKKTSHGCPRKSKRIKKVWTVVTKIKSVPEDGLENENEERRHIIMAFYCQSNEEKKKCQENENAECSEEFFTPNDAIFPTGSDPMAEHPSSSHEN